MKVGIVHPSLNEHAVRGVGVYSRELVNALKKYTNINLVQLHHKEVMKSDCDVFHYPYFDPYFLTLSSKKTKQSVVTVHDLIPLKFPRHFVVGTRGAIKWQLQRFLVRKAGAIITDSDVSKQDIIRLLKIHPSKVHVVHLACSEQFLTKSSPEMYATLQQKYNLFEDYFLFIGANWNKNPISAIRAATNKKMGLVIVSSAYEDPTVLAHPSNEYLRQTKLLIDHNPYVRVLKDVTVAQLSALYQHANALVVPSYYEGFGLPVLEAFASACPVIASDRGSLPEVMGNAGLVINPDDSGSIAVAMQRLRTDSKLRKELIAKGKQRLQLFSWKKTAQETKSVYDRII